MAKTMTGGASAPPKRGRGRPPGSGKTTTTSTASTDTAPGLGHNAPDEGAFLAWVARLRRHDEVIAAAKAAVKVQTNIRKDLRKEAGAAGLVMGDLDDALEDLAKERADLAAREERRRLYRTWLNLPVGGQQEMTLTAHPADPGFQKDMWLKKANTAGRLGEDCPTEGCPPELLQDVQKAWGEGQEILMRASKLLGAGFTGPDQPAATVEDAKAAKAKGNAQAAGQAQPPPPSPSPPPPPPAPVEPKKGGVLVLEGSSFPGIGDVDDCNFKSLIETKREAWQAAATVVVILNSKKRILKEPSDGEAAAYEDTGEEDVPLSEVEDATEADAAQVEAEAEGGGLESAPSDWATLPMDREAWTEEQAGAVSSWMNELEVAETDLGLAFKFHAPNVAPEHEGVRAAMRERLIAMSVDGGLQIPSEPAIAADTINPPMEPDWENLDEDPDNWFADAKGAVRDWIRANPEAEVTHPGALRFMKAMVAADKAEAQSTPPPAQAEEPGLE